jgi:hypothetical protein
MVWCYVMRRFEGCCCIELRRCRCRASQHDTQIWPAYIMLGKGYANASGLESKLFGCLGAEPSYHSIILHVITRCCHLLGSLVLHALVFRYYCC